MKTDSWMIVSKDTRKAIFETYSEKIVKAINVEKYIVMDAYTYLCTLNERIKGGAIDGTVM